MKCTLHLDSVSGCLGSLIDQVDLGLCFQFSSGVHLGTGKDICSLNFGSLNCVKLLKELNCNNPILSFTWFSLGPLLIVQSLSFCLPAAQAIDHFNLVKPPFGKQDLG